MSTPPNDQLNSEYEYLLRGDMYFNLGKYLLSISDYAEACRLEPYDPRAYLGRAEARFLNSNLEDALADLRKALELMPTNALYFLLNGYPILFYLETPAGAMTFSQPEELTKISAQQEAQCIVNLLKYFVDRYEKHLNWEKDDSEASNDRLKTLRSYIEKIK